MQLIRNKISTQRAALAALSAAFTTFLVLSLQGTAHAAAYEMDSVATGVTDQVTEALTVILPIAGGVLALFVGWRLIKRMVSS